jgi:dipeptidyl aminopeptidase/acylaminoacyl peptidase
MRRAAWLVLALAPILAFAQKAPFDFDALLQVQRLADPQVSPDGRTVAFSIAVPDLANNRTSRSVWSVPLAGGQPRKLAEQADRPRWSPDGKKIFYTGTASGDEQIWSMNPDGSGVTQVTHLSTGASGEMVSPDGRFLIATSDVYPECGANDSCNASHAAGEKDNKVKARLITTLLYRHWAAWQGNTRSHLLSISLSDGKVVDLSPGDKVVPTFSLGGPDDYAISPDSREVCFVMNSDPVPATSTNTDLYVVPITGGTPQKITGGMGGDVSPVYSPDGRYLGWRSQARAGYESDKWRLMIVERATGKISMPVDSIDRPVNSFIWSTDSKRLFFTTMDRGRQAIQFVALEGGVVRAAVAGSNVLDDMQFTPDGKTLVFTRQSGDSPVEICKAVSNGAAVALTHLNDDLLSRYQLTPYEEFFTAGAENSQVHSFLLKPPGFDASKKYPALMLIHGGPQSEWAESWSYRWNAQVFAAQGYVVVMTNFHGSVGYGQKFTDDINQDWGGKPYDDIMAATDYTAKLRYVDSERISAAGASYGGYMINWILGHTSRFRALVSHDGPFNLTAKAMETEELWFPMWEFGGMPWQNPDLYEKLSPSTYVKDFRTPTLVIHGELDYRVVDTEGFALFTALQMQKVPSQLLVFPDEGHWVLKPANSQLWYKTVLSWLDNWTKK